MQYQVLIAEDSATQAEMLRALLEDEGYEVEVAVDGRKALDRVRARRPDIILSDLFMPEMDGFALCQAVKSLEETRDVPFVLLTQLNTPAGITIGLQHGADDFIPKPFDEGILLERIRSILAARGGSVALPEPGLEHLPLERASLLLDQRERALRESYESLQALNESLEQQVIERTAAAEARAADLVRSEEALHRSNALLNSLIDAAPLAVVGFDMEGCVTQWNPAAARIFGWQAEEVLGCAPPSIPEGEQPDFARRFDAALGGAPPRNVEVRWRKRNGAPIDVSLWVAPLYHEADQPSGVLMLLEDITQRKELESQLRQSQKMEVVGQLAGGVAHDFNNMLSVINGYSELLLTDEDLPPRTRTFLEEIYRAGERAGALTRQLLAFSRRQVLAPEVLDLTEVVSAAGRMLERLIGENIVLSVASHPGLGRVKVDPCQIEQVLMNLAINARDAMPRGGRLTIQLTNARRTPAPRARPAPDESEEFVLLAITDNGTGMTEEVQSRLFEPFFTTKEAGKGTGLGLATVYGIVAQSGGWIEVDSEPDRGSTFRIYLPRVDSEVSEQVGLAPPSTTAGSETILLVEDEPTVRTLIRGMLESQGYAVLEATTPGEALHLCQRYSGSIHMVLTDVVMPVMSGREVSERLLAVCPTMKVLFMSGYTQDTVIRTGVLTDKTAFIYKPFTCLSLARKVREVLGQQASDPN